jgi:hypothetical protein
MQDPTRAPEPKWAYQLDQTHLYRYASDFDWLEPVLRRSEIYAPTIPQLNDPRDSRPRITKMSALQVEQFLTGLVKGRANVGVITQDEHDRLVDEIRAACVRMGPDDLLRYATTTLHSLSESVRIYCMSKRWDNMSMWAKYANGRKGYCLAFRHMGDSLFMSAREVIYSDSVGLELTDPNDTPNWYFHKTPEWSNEEEVRIVMPLTWDAPVQIFPLTLCGIILGENAAPVDVERVKAWSAQRYNFTVKQARYDVHEGRLIATTIYTSPDSPNCAPTGANFAA